MKISIDAHIRSNLNLRRGRWAELARQSGVSYSWLSKFARGLIENPGLRTLERLSAAMDEPVFPLTCSPPLPSLPAPTFSSSGRGGPSQRTALEAAA